MKPMLVLVLILMFVSCKGGGGGGSSSGSGIISQSGIWEHCENYDSDGDSSEDSSLKRILVIGDSVTLIRTNFNGLNCQLADAGYRFVDAFSATRSGNSYNLSLVDSTYVSLSDLDLAYDIATSWCGISNWVKNQVRNVIGLDCEGEVSNIGDTATFVATRSGESLTVDQITYTLTADADLIAAGQSLPNGNYIYSDFSSFAMYATFSNGSYSVFRYNFDTMTYSREQGIYTSSDNSVTFTVTSSLPVGCYAGAETRRFRSGSGGVVMEFAEEDLVVIAPKVSDSEALFRSSYIGGTYSVGCI